MRLTDEDGIDEPFDRAIKRAMRADRRVPVFRAITVTAEMQRIVAGMNRQTECYADGWSVAQHCRRGA